MRRFALLVVLLCCLFASATAQEVMVGATDTESYMPLVEGKRVAILANHTAMYSSEEHIVDMMHREGVNIVGIFSPEHGFRGSVEAGEKVKNSVDERTGIPILSLYDGNTQRPSDDVMRSFDTLVVDMQDVGLRFYTYYITMLQIMEACADFCQMVIVLDRPNPNGHYVDGPILDMKYKSRGVEWSLGVDEDMVVVADRFHLLSALSALADNAIKYGGEPPQVAIEASQKRDMVAITVADNGRGIARREQRRIFEKFYRIGEGNRHTTRGYGLGLYYVKMIVERHGGRVVVSSSREGSRLTIKLPRYGK